MNSFGQIFMRCLTISKQESCFIGGYHMSLNILVKVQGRCLVMVCLDVAPKKLLAYGSQVGFFDSFSPP